MSAKIESLLNLSVYDKVLDSKSLELLNILLKRPNLSAYDIYEIRKGEKYYTKKGISRTWYSSIRRNLERLCELKLVEVNEKRSDEEKKTNTRKPYLLSINRIFYLISNVIDRFYSELIIPLLQNYGSNILFTLFLYPYFNRKTLLEIKDEVVFDIIYNYLNNVCRTIHVSLKSMHTLIYQADEQGYILNRLFMWPRESIPLSSPESIPFDTAELINYLKATFNWEWANSSRITPIYDGKMVDIINPPFKPEEIIRLLINEKDNKAQLMKNGKHIGEFVITTHDLFLSIDARTKKRKIDIFIEYLVGQCKDHTTSFLTNLRSQIKAVNQGYQLLSKDEKFVCVRGYR
jgi:hypothetical protein